MRLERALHWRTDTERRRISRAHGGVLVLDGLQLPKEPVVLGIRQSGTVEHVILVLRASQQIAQIRSALHGGGRNDAHAKNVSGGERGVIRRCRGLGGIVAIARAVHSGP